MMINLRLPGTQTLSYGEGTHATQVAAQRRASPVHLQNPFDNPRAREVN